MKNVLSILQWWGPGLENLPIRQHKDKLWQNPLQNKSNQNQTVFVASESLCLRLRPNQYQYHGLKTKKNYAGCCVCPMQSRPNQYQCHLVWSTEIKPRPNQSTKTWKKTKIFVKISLHQWNIWLILGRFRPTCFWQKNFTPNQDQTKTETKAELVPI